MSKGTSNLQEISLTPEHTPDRPAPVGELADLRGGSVTTTECLQIGQRERDLFARRFLADFFKLPLLPQPQVTTEHRVVALLAWGKRQSAQRAERLAAAAGLSCWKLAQGFLHAVDPRQDPVPLSIVVDDRGWLDDARRESRLEALVRQPLSAEQRDRSEALIATWQAGRVSRHNHLREDSVALPVRYVLVLDQARGDEAVASGMADADSFQLMLETALANHIDSIVVVMRPPEVLAGRKRGYLDVAKLQKNPRILLPNVDVHLVRLLENAQAVYTVTSPLGFEGLLWQKPVYTFGMPFYAGWGLTRDLLPPPERRGAASLQQLVHATLVEYARYRHPETGAACTVEHVLDYLALQRRMRERFPAQVYARGFSRWQRPMVRCFLQGSDVRFLKPDATVPAGTVLAQWGASRVAKSTVVYQGPLYSTLRLEDGFLRSVGLAAQLIRPLSWVQDGSGMYYDPAEASDLETLLQNHAFDALQLARAARLRRRIVEQGVSKYNVGLAAWRRPETQRRVILVPGQVENDASVRLAAPGVRTNMGLLQAVRSVHPEAYIIYKSHPAVSSGLRKAGLLDIRAADWCDEVVSGVDIAAMLPQVDEVHVLTSLAGFEALLHGVPVTTYGQPFFAGWGLTSDMCPLLRRTRRLTLDMLVAGALLEYPTYISGATGRYTTAERVLDELQQARQDPPRAMAAWENVLQAVWRWWMSRV